MLLSRFVSLVVLLSIPFAEGFGGIENKLKDATANKEEGANQPLVDFKDPELLQAMEMFAAMSPDEMVETMAELKKMLGDDPETLAAIEQVAAEIPNMKASDVQSSLQQLVEEDEIAVATKDALELLKSGAWDTIWEKRDLILEAVIASGKLSAMDAARFKSSPEEWGAELKHIWNELQKLADAENNEL